MPTVESTEKALHSLDDDGVLGFDMLAPKILKHCSHVLAPILHRLIVAILIVGEWPALWMTHWVVPLFKRKSVYDAAEYRGIRLTS